MRMFRINSRGMALLLLLSLLALSFGCAPPAVNPGNESSTKAEAEVADGGTDKLGERCNHLCDCSQGQACVQGKCASPAPGLTPLYCCTQPGCVPGAKCSHPDNRQDTCKGKPQCITSADCGQPSCKNNGNDCEEQIPDCIGGKCTNLPKPVKDALCDANQGVCTPRAPSCKVHCDCAQGQFCNKGKCQASTTPVYCCSKLGCPAKASCYEKEGGIGTCKGDKKCSKNTDCGPTRCSQKGTQCTELQASCQSDGSCKSTSRTLAGRCSPNGTCVSTQKCHTHCDCPQGVVCLQGQCVPVSSRLTLCCDKAGCPKGKACYKKDGTPDVCGEVKACKSDSDCGTKTCRDEGAGGCSEEIPFCDKSSGRCSFRKQSRTRSTCNNTTGTCTPILPPGCKAHCDCPQGLACLQGKCGKLSSGKPLYCCDKSGCPKGTACFDKVGNQKTCGGTTAQCSKDSDCGNKTCRNTGSSCMEKKPKCNTATKTCVTATEKKVANSSCQPLTGVCKAKPCVGHCDCKQGFFCWQGVCQRTSYAYYCCDNPGCPALAVCVSRSGSQDFCPIACKSACDCPSGQDCVTGKCKQGSSPVYCCDNSQQCPVGASCKSKTNVKGTCPAKLRPCKTVCDCVQGEACTNGTCQKTSNPVYCCEKAGCVAGKGCVSKANLSGICPKSCKAHCDCDQGAACVKGLCQRSPLFGNTYCCTKPGCPLGQFCRQPNGQYGRCPQKSCQSPCDCQQGEDCRNGTCLATQPPVYCCGKSGCLSGATCKDKNNKWGKCTTQASCQSPCDCNQGQDCYQGQCVGVFPSVYCCDNIGCPVGQACYTKSNQASTCKGAPCKTSCDCPVQGQSCVRGRCTYLLGSARVYCCDKPFCPAGNKCQDKAGNFKTCSQQKCKTPCDCNQGEDCRNNQCVLVTPAVYCCGKIGCPRRSSCVTKQGIPSQCN